MVSKIRATMMMALVLSTLIQTSLGAPAPAPAPFPTTLSACKLPDGFVIMAPELTGTTNQAFAYHILQQIARQTVKPVAAVVVRGLHRGRRLMQASAPSPSTIPSCCPLTGVQPGDTVTSLLTSAGLTADVKPFFYAINPDVPENTETLTPGVYVTVPCYRIVDYYNLLDMSPAPAPTAVTGR